ncbi:hypothetical protein [Parvimonas parva]|uniref:CopG family transcriptional regulator n=1 Tax=Parvimonas parva TaxID=2769485 RepID=A0ABS1C959_9FIRM|nr:hypothetical protein [Parvimonas parva]MBK1468638.1 hypothetical protein [Parvimonas parva]
MKAKERKDILIRGVNEKIYSLLEIESKKKGISKNKLLKEILENYFVDSSVRLIDEKYQSLVKENSKVIDENTKILKILIGE